MIERNGLVAEVGRYVCFVGGFELAQLIGRAGAPVLWRDVSKAKNLLLLEVAELPLEEVKWELTESKKRLEGKLGCEMIGFAYPYGSGAYKPEVRKAALEAGYRFDFSVKQGISALPWNREQEAVKRLLIRGDDTMFDFHLNMTRGKARF